MSAAVGYDIQPAQFCARVWRETAKPSLFEKEIRGLTAPAGEVRFVFRVFLFGDTRFFVAKIWR